MVGSALPAGHAEVAEKRVSFRRLGMMIGLVTAPVLALDQLTKLYIASHFKPYEMVPLIHNWLALTYTLNPGAAFSLFATMSAEFRGVFFIALSAIAIVVLVALLMRGSTSLSYSIAFALILGGTIGNLIDRLARGKVIDFIYFHHDSFSYPVFNIADSAITIGVALIIIVSIFDGRSEAPPAK